jgi:hypothetical protein
MSKTPLTAEQQAEITRGINTLPEPLRSYVIDLETEADPAGTIRQNFLLRAENASLRKECEDLDVAAARYRYIREHYMVVVPTNNTIGEYSAEDLDQIVDQEMAREAAKP